MECIMDREKSKDSLQYLFMVASCMEKAFKIMGNEVNGAVEMAEWVKALVQD